jgi:hypothetical protein
VQLLLTNSGTFGAEGDVVNGDVTSEAESSFGDELDGVPAAEETRETSRRGGQQSEKSQMDGPTKSPGGT